MSAGDPLLELARSLAREAARRVPRALVHVVETRTLRAQLETGSPVARTASREGVQVTLRAEGPRGLGSAEEWLGRSERPRAVLRVALAAARTSRDGGSLVGALAGTTPVPPPRPCPTSWGREWAGEGVTEQIFSALSSRRPDSLAIDATIDHVHRVVAFAGPRGEERLHVRSRGAVRVEGELQDGAAVARLGFAHELSSPSEWPSVLRAARAAGREAALRAHARAESVTLGSPRVLLLAPEVVTWILHGPIVEGFALARAGEPSGVAPWLEVDDEGDAERDPDEQGIVAARVPLVRDGAWLRGPFHPFDGSGRTRRDGRSAVPRAPLATLSLRPGAAAPRHARSKLGARADGLLAEVASADPLPGGGVFVVAHASRRRGRRFVSAGLAGVRLDAGELFEKTIAVSREVEAVQALELPVLAPWLLVTGVALRPA